MNGIALEGDCGSNAFLYNSPDKACFRIPLNMISSFEMVFHWYDFSVMLSAVLVRSASPKPIPSSSLVGNILARRCVYSSSAKFAADQLGFRVLWPIAEN